MTSFPSCALPRWIFRALFLILPCVPGFVAAQSQNSLGRLSLFEKEVTLAADSASQIHALPDSFLIAESETMFADSVLLKRGADYVIDYLSGTISFKTKLIANTEVKLQYKILPFGLRRTFAHREIVTENKDPENATRDSSRTQLPGPKPKAVNQETFGSNLRKSGSIIRGITVGTDRDLQVDSGLRMQISGRLANNIDVVASLTDRNTPLQPEGNTQTLREIDKVFVEIKGPRAGATLGDYNLRFEGTEFTRYQRKLQGAMAKADFENLSVTVSGAVSRGRFTTNEFQGREGNQGPYQLTGSEGQIDIIVLAGTERVWIDGQPMTRGESHDYSIEYGNGQITFTRNRLITSDSRVTVDFQFSDESFQRNLWAVRGESNFFAEKLKFSTTFIRESDDRDNLLSGRVLDEDFRNALDQSGDSLAIVPGWVFVGQDSGNYTMDNSGIFVFVGTNSGDHRVSFSFFGENSGDYRSVGLGRFEYVGLGQGSYRPFILLPQPQRHDVVGLNLDFSPGSAVSIKTELALSQFDRNLFSARDDSDNGGAAYAVSLNFQPERIAFGGRKLGKIALRSRLRRRNTTFQDIDRTTQVEFNRRWNVSGSTSPEETIGEIRGSYLPFKGLTFEGGAGKLSKSSAFSSDRWDARTRLNRPGLPRIDYYIEKIERDNQSSNQKSSWLRHRGHADFDLTKVKPILDYEGEIRKDTRSDTGRSGFRFDSFTGGLQLSPWKSMTASFRYNYRDDREREGSTFLKKSIARTQYYTWSLRNWQAISATASYTHRNREFADPGTPATRTDLADLRLNFSPRKSWVRSNLYYQISNTQVARQEELYFEVEEGQGNFRFNPELNEFEPDPFGSFVRRVVATNEFVPVVELRFRTDLRLAPKKLFKSGSGTEKKSLFQRVLTPLSTESFLRIDERTREKDVERIYLLQLSRFQQDSTTIFGSIEFRQDLHLWENSRKLSFRYRHRNRKEKNNQFIGGGQDRQVREHQLRGLKQFSNQVSARVELTRSAEDRIFKALNREDRKIRTNAAELDLVYRPDKRLEIGLRSQTSFSSDIIAQPVTTANSVSLAPRSNYSLNKKGRFRGEVTWTNVSVSPRDRLIPFELTNGNRAGATLRWNFSFDYRVSQNVQASLSYFGRNEPDRPRTQHFVKVEMRAFF